MFGYLEIESLHHSPATLLQLVNVILFVQMQQDINTITPSVIDYFNISKFGMTKDRKFTLKFSYLILVKIVEVVATRDQILRQKCTKFNIGRGSVPDPARGAYSAPPDSLAGFRGPTSKGGEESEREGTEGAYL